MADSAVAIGYGANVGLAVLLATLAALAWRARRRGPGRGWLALYLALVAAGYLADALSFLLTDGPRHDPLARASVVLSRLDPAPFVLFALALGGRASGWRIAALLFAPGALLAAWSYDAPAGLVALHLATYYVAALTLVARAYLRAPTSLARERLGVLLLAAAVVVVPRLPLTYLDAGLVRGIGGRASPATVLPLEGGLLLGAALFVGALLHAARGERAADARRLSVRFVAIVSVVGAVWMLRFFPGLRDGVFALAYAIRWYLFALVVTLGERRHGAHLDGVAPRRMAVGAIALLVAAQVAALLAHLEEVDSARAMLGGTAVVAAAAVGWAGLRAAFPPLDVEAVRRREAYRAHVCLGRADDAELERLRVELGLEVEDAARIAREARVTVVPMNDAPCEGATFAARYDVEQVVGAGGFGRVFSAWDRARGERVVLKELMTVPDAESTARLAREVDAASRVEHPNLVAFRALEPGARGPVLVMQHVDGETLRERFARGRLDVAETRALAVGLLDALAALHDAGVVHRDVKPENLMLARDGRVVLLDFGEAATVRRGTTHEAVGRARSPPYASPEQERGGAVDARSDLYSAAVLVWEALAGARPPAGDVPDAWRAPLRRALAPEPEARFPDARAFAAALPL